MTRQKIFLSFFLTLLLFAQALLKPKPLAAGTLMTIKDLLSNSRLSYNQAEPTTIQTAIHNLSFTTATSVTNGTIRVMIPASATNNNDGQPDLDGFDLNGLTSRNLSCPTGDVRWEAPTASVSGSRRCLTGYACFECRFTGTLPANSPKSFIIGDLEKKLINPVAGVKHTAGKADIYTTLVYLYSFSSTGGYTLTDSSRTKTAIIEAVPVTAEVEATLTFTVAGLPANLTKCGQLTSIATTTDTVPFGNLTANVFKHASQLLTVSTNNSLGYLVTLEEDQPLGLDGSSLVKIPDSGGDDGTATDQVKANWANAIATNSAAYGLGYSLENVTGNDAAFSYNDWQNSLIKQLPCTTSSEICGTQDSAAIIMSNQQAVSESAVNVCYRLNVAKDQPAGNYWNKVKYVAMPRF